METRVARRRAIARKPDETGKKLLLAGLAVVLVGLLAFELPKLLKGSSSSSSTASTPAAASAPAAAATGSTPAAGATRASAARARAIDRMPARNPFVPFISASTTSTGSATAPTATAAAGATGSVATTPSIHFTPAASAQPARTTPEVTTPVHVKPPAPTAAVIWTNGLRQLVGRSHVFTVGDVEFRLVGVTPEAMRIEIVGGAFADGKQTITARRGHRLQLTNTATGVEYDLLFTAGTANAPSTPTSAGTKP
jgi:hypothetical protein